MMVNIDEVLDILGEQADYEFESQRRMPEKANTKAGEALIWLRRGRSDAINTAFNRIVALKRSKNTRTPQSDLEEDR